LVVLFLPNSAYATSESEILYQRGNSYFDQRQYDLAIANYTKAIVLDPQYIKAYYFRGLIYNEISTYDLAIADYTKLVELKPNGAEYYLTRAYMYKSIGENALASADENSALELQPQLKFNLGSIKPRYSTRPDLPEAMQQFYPYYEE